MSKVARALRERRVAIGWSQRQLANEMNTCQSHVSELESDKCEPRLSVLQRWAGALGYDVELVDRRGAR